MNKKKIMIMGAGIYQVPLIQKAKQMGLETVVISIPGNYPGIALADRFYSFDTRAKEQILEVAKQEKISGICTSGTDIAVKTIGYVCQKMGLCGIGEAAANMVTDKALMKEALAKGNVSTAAFEKVTSYEEALQAAEHLGYPVVVKAVDSSGSRGISRADDEKELERSYQASIHVTKKEYVLVEQFIDAAEMGVDAYVGEEGIESFYPHQKFTLHWKGVTIPAGHKFPYPCSDVLYQELYRQIEASVKALGLKNCPLNADVFVKGDQVWIIEIGGRTGATCIPELISLHQGFDWYELLIRASMGETLSFDSKRSTPAMAKLIFSPVDGTVTAIDQDKLCQLEKEGYQYQLDINVGDRVEEVKNGTDRIGHLIGYGADEAVFDQKMQEFRSCIWLDQGNLAELNHIEA